MSPLGASALLCPRVGFASGLPCLLRDLSGSKRLLDTPGVIIILIMHLRLVGWKVWMGGWLVDDEALCSRIGTDRDG